MRKLAAGNWKMNGTRADLVEIEALLAAHPAPGCDMLLCPPATLIAAMAALASGTRLSVGAQDCHAADGGAHTGEISARQLADAGATAVIVGHSERRADHGETDAIVRAKAEAAIRAGLTAVICLGETEAERDAGTTLDVVARQLGASWPDTAGPDTAIVAYEPIWAIGTGRTPTLPQIMQVHAHLRAGLRSLVGAEASSVRLLYGGSVKPSNAAAIFALPDVDGALVGGASLKAVDFSTIVRMLAEA